MPSRRTGLINTADRLATGALAGVLAAGVYTLEQEADLRLLDRNTDDLLLLGRLVTKNRDTARAVGLGLHLLNGAALGIAYVALARDRLPGPPWVRGVTAALAETVALYPLSLLENQHPGIRDGQLDSYRSVRAFAQSVLRHIAFGAALGTTTARLLDRKEESRRTPKIQRN